MGLSKKISLPLDKNISSKNGTIKIKWNKENIQEFNSNLDKLGAYQDKRCVDFLMKYVSFKTGTQQKSIPISSEYGSGLISINVPYAHYQAYSPNIKKRVGLKGTYPWERMVADKKDVILKELAEYSRRLNG